MQVTESRVLAQGRRWGELVALALIAAVAAALRFSGLGAESLWSDELATAYNIQYGLFTAEFWSELRDDVHPPGYFALLRLWTLVAGSGEVALRALSALAGVGLCVALFALARRYLGSAVGLLAALLGALSPLLVQYSHEARSYSLLCLCTTWVAHAWCSLVEPDRPERGSALTAARAGLAAAAAAYVHYSGLIVACVIALIVAAYAVIAARDALRRVVEAGAVAAVLYAPWMPSLFADLQKGGLTFLRPPDAIDALGYPLQVLPSQVFIAIAALAVLGPLATRLATAPSPDDGRTTRTKVEPVFVAFLAAWLVLTLALFYFKSRISTPIFNVRNLIVVAPPILILAAWAALRGFRASRAATILSAAVIAGICGHHVLFDSSSYGHRSREDFREAAQCAIALADKAKGAPIIALTYDDYFDYYLRQLGSDLVIAKSVSKSSRLADAADAAWSKGADHLIVVWAHIPLKNRDKKRILEDRALLERKKLSKAGCMLLARE